MSQYFAEWPDGFRVVWRNLTKAEYNKFHLQFESSPFQEPMHIALAIYQLVCIQGPDYKFVPAGIPAYICKQQLLNNPFSGKFEDIAPAISMARKLVTGDYLLSATGLIASVLNYKPEEIENWDPNIFFIRLAQAELATGRSFEPVDPRATYKAPDSRKPTKRPPSESQQRVMDRVKERGRV